MAAFGRASGVVARAEALLAEPRPTNRLRRAVDRVTLGGTAAFGMAGVAFGVLALRGVMSALGICCM